MADDIFSETKKNTALLTEIKNKQAEAREKEDAQKEKDLKFEKKERKAKAGFGGGAICQDRGSGRELEEEVEACRVNAEAGRA